MSILSRLLYLACILSFIFYLTRKYAKRAYIFSTFNLGLYTYSVAIFILPVFYYINQSWEALKIANAATMARYLDLSVAINGIGYLIYIYVLFVREFYGKKPKLIERYGRLVSNSIINQIVDICFVCMIIFWYIICAIYCKGIPLLGGNRTFYLNTGISPIYLFLNEGIQICTFYYGIQYSSKKKKGLFLILGIITVALQGNRSSLFVNLLAPIIMIFAYYRLNASKRTRCTLSNGENLISANTKGNVEETSNRLNKKRKKSVTRKLIFAMFIILIIAIVWGFLRTGRIDEISRISVFEDIIYGNTFSDIRDGAYILYGFEKKANNAFVIGKTYLSALISFVPSSLSSFRTEWAWGRYTAYGLFGMSNHFGLRGGNALEAYINFGWLGVVVFSTLQGVLAGTLENVFYRIFITEENKISGKEYFVFYILYSLYGVLCSSSGAYNIYSLLFLIFGMIMLSSIIRYKR